MVDFRKFCSGVHWALFQIDFLSVEGRRFEMLGRF